MNDIKSKLWTHESLTGNKQIDEEHYQLFVIWAELKDLSEKKSSLSEFALILTKMTDYSLKHFKREEEYMAQMAYPKLAEHKNYHKNYIYKVSMYNLDLLSGNPPDPNEIVSFLENWWDNHILKIDTEYEAFKNEIKSNVIY
jgi:hemerythrin-like metal-binding protein